MDERPDVSLRWLLLIYRIKAESSGRRTYVWRQLRQLGAVYLQQAAAVLLGAAEEPVQCGVQYVLPQRVTGGKRGGTSALLFHPPCVVEP